MTDSSRSSFFFNFERTKFAPDDSKPLPVKLAEMMQVYDCVLSRDCRRILCHVKPRFKKSEHETCSIWIADVDVPELAHPFIFKSGSYNDTNGRFHPDGQNVVFLSDRPWPGDPKRLFIVSINGGMPRAFLGTDNKNPVASFAISPNGQYIAFLNADILRNPDQGSDEYSYQNKMSPMRLRLYSFSTQNVQNVQDQNVATGARSVRFMVWSSDSKSIAWISTRHEAPEFWVGDIRFIITSISEDKPVLAYMSSIVYARLPGEKGEFIWPINSTLYEIQKYNPSSSVGANRLCIRGVEASMQRSYLYGDFEDVVAIVDLMSDGLIAVEIASNLNSRVDVLQQGEKLITLYETTDNAITAWHALRREDKKYVFVAILSSASRQEPPNIWSSIIDENGLASPCVKLARLSEWWSHSLNLSTEIFEYKSIGGIDLSGLITYPAEGTNVTKPYPTILLLHDGPYARETLTYDFDPSRDWRFMLAAHGFLVLSPNYRGSMGRGHAFASAIAGKVGITDWPDCACMVNAAIDRGLANKERLGIGGWGYGAFLAAWGTGAGVRVDKAARTAGTTSNANVNGTFSMGILGAGIYDWEQLVAESDSPDHIEDLYGSAPWQPQGSIIDNVCSPIRSVATVTTSILIIHGEKDERVPVSQGISFYRGLKRKCMKPHEISMSVFPRESHSISEREHAISLMGRVIAHFESLKL